MNALSGNQQDDCQNYVPKSESKETRGDLGGGANGRWLHSDIKDRAYPFVRALFLSIIQRGGLHD